MSVKCKSDFIFISIVVKFYSGVFDSNVYSFFFFFSSRSIKEKVYLFVISKVTSLAILLFLQILNIKWENCLIVDSKAIKTFRKIDKLFVSGQKQCQI